MEVGTPPLGRSDDDLLTVAADALNEAMMITLGFGVSDIGFVFHSLKISPVEFPISHFSAELRRELIFRKRILSLYEAEDFQNLVNVC